MSANNNAVTDDVVRTVARKHLFDNDFKWEVEFTISKPKVAF